jgi:hypothetical protein
MEKVSPSPNETGIMNVLIWFPFFACCQSSSSMKLRGKGQIIILVPVLDAVILIRCVYKSLCNYTCSLHGMFVCWFLFVPSEFLNKLMEIVFFVGFGVSGTLAVFYTELEPL